MGKHLLPSVTLLPGHLCVIPCPLFFLKVHSLTRFWEAAERTEPSEPGRPDGPAQAGREPAV